MVTARTNLTNLSLNLKRKWIQSQEFGPPSHLNAGKGKCISETNPHDLTSWIVLKTALLPQDLGAIWYLTVP